MAAIVANVSRSSTLYVNGPTMWNTFGKKVVGVFPQVLMMSASNWHRAIISKANSNRSSSFFTSTFITAFRDAITNMDFYKTFTEMQTELPANGSTRFRTVVGILYNT